MSFYTIYLKSIKISYKSKLLSESTLFYSLCLISNLFIPLFIVYRSDGFWRKIEFFSEQPDINFKHNLILVLQLNHSLPGFKFWSTYPQLNSVLRSNQLSLPYITNREIDVNGDGKYDELNIDLNVAINPNEEVIGTQLILFFDYKINVTNIEYYSLKNGRRLRVIGDLVFHQKVPLVYRKHYIPNNDLTNHFQDFFIEDFLEAYVRRNFSTSLNSNTHYKWFAKHENISDFDINVKIVYNNDQMFYYRTGFWFLIKWAFIQYFAIYLVLRFLIKKIISFVFDNRLLNCIECHPIISENK
ncbi:transmembrane protein 231-like [Oppia nitens]|uniref:transmembrane protein 231-like n=1 Tax=Oppia nitens TaxID=1686743 RepID=UPI0023DAFCBA|nr:transmembrane protein 231-like [Oppia nitens]